MIVARDERHGPLPSLLYGFTFVTGLIDAASYLGLDHVFVANMTGNVVFLGFAFARAGHFVAAPSLLALAGFLTGAFVGGRLVNGATHRGGALATAVLSMLPLVALATALVALRVTGPSLGLVTFLLAVAMGVQNATVRRLAVPDLTTTVLTMTLTGLTADASFAGGAGPRPVRRIVSALAMLAGAAVGALLFVRAGIVPPLALVLALLLAIGVASSRTRDVADPWSRFA